MDQKNGNTHKEIFFADSHFHFCDDISMKEYLEEAQKEKVKYFLLNTGGDDEAQMASLVAEEFDAVRFTAGIHPGCVEEMKEEEFETLPAKFQKFAEHPLLGAVGEIGMDLYYGGESEEKQQKVFSTFLELALQWNKPVTVHCRDKENSFRAYEITYLLLKEYAEKGGIFDLHCYAGNIPWAEKFLDLGGYFGLGGMVTFKKAENIREIARYIPLDRMVLETDAPYLAPIPYRGKPNRSKYIPIIGEYLAVLKKISLQECAFVTTENTKKLFGFP